MNYSTDHGISYADRERERNSPSFVYIFHRCSMCPRLVTRQPSMRQSISFHTRVTISRSTRATCSGDTVAKIWWIAESEGTKTVSFINHQKKKLHGVKSGDRGGHRINASSSFPVRHIQLCGQFRLRYPLTSLW